MASKRSSRKPKAANPQPKSVAQTPSEQLPGDFPIVGIGASAGGLEAFSHLLQPLPQDTGMAFVLVQHLAPEHDSLLSEILTRTTAMNVHEVQDGMEILPNCVYVIPPNTLMTLEEGCLKLQPRQRTRGKYMPIDAFFTSLAEDHSHKAIAIVLSGGDDDGSLGLAAIKAAGGITFAQDPGSAEVSKMPQNAIATGCVDFVLAPAGIAQELIKISRHPYVMRPLAATPEGADGGGGGSSNLEALSRIFVLLRRTMGVDFSHYKQGTIRRRIMRRMVLHNLEQIDDYVQYLQDHSTEVEDLYHDILINVTSFFREADTFTALRETVFPSIVPAKSSDSPIRIWIPGCATGEEAYSIAISLLEFLDDRTIKPMIQIFATDISEVAIEQARLGIYAQTSLAEISPERLRRFFVPVEGGYQISKSVRELCIFARQDLTRDPPFSRLDLVSCRNVLIYLEPVLQKKIMPIFHYALKPTGFLMLGSSESIGEFSDLFAIADKKSRIYSRKFASVRLNFNFMTSQLPIDRSSGNSPAVTEVWSDSNLAQAADGIVLDRYAPAGVIVNAELEILQFRGQTSPYLEPAPGKASFNLLKMARAELGLELRAAIHRANQSGTAVRKTGLPLQIGDDRQIVSLDVIPFNQAGADNRYFLVLFSSSRVSPAPMEIAQSATSPSPSSLEQEVTRLQQELSTTKEYLQSIIETQEGTNQDLKVANEEILSSNEELQSTNEELETAKEEIQATNEELSTINEELRSRNIQLNNVNSDLQNLLSSVNIPILMLSGELRIRRFTPLAEPLFNLIPTDIGRPFSDIQHNLELSELSALSIAVIDSLNTHEQEVQDRRGHWYSLCIRPYKNIDNQIDGAVISLIDIDALKRNAVLLERSRDYANAIVETIREPLVVLNSVLQVVTANQSFYQTFQLQPTQVENQRIFDLGQGEWDIARLRSLLEEVLPKNNLLQDFEVEQEFANLGHRTMLLNARKIEQGGAELILLAIEDITARKQAEGQLRSSLQEKELLLREIRHRVKNNLQVISSLLSLQLNRVSDAGVAQILQDSQTRVQTIGLMYEVLHQSTSLTSLNFAEYVKTLVNYVFSSFNKRIDARAPQVSVPQALKIHPDQAVLCGLILNELLTNALKYGVNSAEDQISVVVTPGLDHQITIAVGNDGDRLPADFDLESIQSIGLQLVMNLVEQLNGTLRLDRKDRTIFEVGFRSAI
jgi:two-component system, chemotaxis family, CheB/CheR fusion protein